MADLLMNAVKGLASGMDDQDVRELLGAMKPKHVADGENVLEQGEPTDSMYVVVSGKLAVRLKIPGRTLTVAEIQHGGWVGEIAMLDPGPASATVGAVGDASVLVLSYADLLEFRKKHPKASMQLLRTLSRDLALRLSTSTTGVMEKQPELETSESKPAADEGWLTSLLKKVLSRGGEA